MTVAGVEPLERNLWSMWAQFGRGPGCVLVDDPDLLRYETPVSRPPYNLVLRSHFDDASAERRVDEAIAAYRDREVPLVWLVHPTARPADLRAMLADRGFSHAELVTGMVAPLDALPDTPDPHDGVTIERVGPGHEEEFVDLVAWRYSLEPEEHPVLTSIMRANAVGEPGAPTQAWVARVDDQVVGKAVVHLAGDTAGLYALATRPEARGHGLGRLLTLVAFDHGRRSGATIGVLHSTPMAVSLYRSLGFEHVVDFELWTDADFSLDG